MQRRRKIPKKREILHRDINRNKFINKTKGKVKIKTRSNSQTGRLELDKKNGKRKTERNPVDK